MVNTARTQSKQSNQLLTGSRVVCGFSLYQKVPFSPNNCTVQVLSIRHAETNNVQGIKIAMSYKAVVIHTL